MEDCKQSNICKQSNMKGIKKKEKEKIQALVKELLYNQIQTVLKSSVDIRREKLQEAKKWNWRKHNSRKYNNE